MLAAALVGFHPLWPQIDVTVSEAAALQDAGEVVRLVWTGRDPNRRWRVRYGVLRTNEYELRPLEAAVGARRLEVLHTLLDHGAMMDAALRLELLCFASKRGARDIVEFLTGSDANAPIDCRDVPTPW